MRFAEYLVANLALKTRWWQHRSSDVAIRDESCTTRATEIVRHLLFFPIILPYLPSCYILTGDCCA